MEERPLRSGLLAFLLCAIASLTLGQPASAANKVSIGVLKFGTVSWLLDTIHANGLDKAEGIDLDIVPLASTQATTVGLQGGSVDIIATDWLWVSRERSSGGEFTFSPFTTALGAIMVPPNSPIKTLGDLKGKRLGVAGGPLDKSWLLLVAYALRTANLDLRTETKPEYGAPWISMSGADRATARVHTTIAVPGATTASTGLPDNNKMGGAWIMNAGTTTAHIMIPGS